MEKQVEIKAATLKDDFCHYAYEIKDGPTAGDEVKRKGSLIVHNDLKNAFFKLNAHLAVICEEINPSVINDIESIEKYDDSIHTLDSVEQIVSHFHVNSFAISGNGENESVILSGSKRLSNGDFVELKSPKTAWDSNYQFINELRAAIDIATEEVVEYMYGKSSPKFVQAKMDFGKDDDDGQGDDNNGKEEEEF